MTEKLASLLCTVFQSCTYLEPNGTVKNRDEQMGNSLAWKREYKELQGWKVRLHHDRNETNRSVFSSEGRGEKSVDDPTEIALHLIVHVKSERNSCIKNEKREKKKVQTLASFSSLRWVWMSDGQFRKVTEMVGHTALPNLMREDIFYVLLFSEVAAHWVFLSVWNLSSPFLSNSATILSL